MHHLFDHLLAQAVLRMRLAGKDELYWPALVGNDPQQPVRISEQQSRTLVRGKPAGKPDSQRFRIKEFGGTAYVNRGSNAIAADGLDFSQESVAAEDH